MTNAIHDNQAEVTAQSSEGRVSYRQTYREVAEPHVVEVDAIEQLKANLAQLEDLHARLKFMMGELSYLIRKS